MIQGKHSDRSSDQGGHVTVDAPGIGMKLQRYKEILYGVLLGLLMWIVDAVMHAQAEREGISSRALIDELLRPGLMQLFFRSFYILIAVMFGLVLWRVDQKRKAAERRERAQEIETERLRAIIAMVNTFQHEVREPLNVIIGNSGRLGRNLESERDQKKLRLIIKSALSISTLLSELAKSAPEYIVDTSGVERLVPRGSAEQQRP